MRGRRGLDFLCRRARRVEVRVLFGAGFSRVEVVLVRVRKGRWWWVEAGARERVGWSLMISKSGVAASAGC